MHSSIIRIINEIIDNSLIRKTDIARCEGITVPNLCNRLNESYRKDMSCANAAKLMSYCGYQLVAVPKGAKLPNNSYVVELREQ